MGSQEVLARSWYHPQPEQLHDSNNDSKVVQVSEMSVKLIRKQSVVVHPLADIIKENHFAQLATFEQQLEMMRYMRRLNSWLERDAQDRTNELRGVIERLQRLRQVVHDIQLREPEESTLTSTSSESADTTVRQDIPAVQVPITQHYYPPGFQPFPIPQQQPIAQQAIPDRPTRTARPPIPQPAAQPTIIILPTAQSMARMVPIIPRENYIRRPVPDPEPPSPEPLSRTPIEEHIFIPPESSIGASRRSLVLTPPPVPPQNMVYISQSSSSSRVSHSTSPRSWGYREASRRRLSRGSRERDVDFHIRQSSRSRSRGRRPLSHVQPPHAVLRPPILPTSSFHPPQPVAMAQSPSSSRVTSSTSPSNRHRKRFSHGRDDSRTRRSTSRGRRPLSRVPSMVTPHIDLPMGRTSISAFTQPMVMTESPSSSRVTSSTNQSSHGHRRRLSRSWERDNVRVRRSTSRGRRPPSIVMNAVTPPITLPSATVPTPAFIPPPPPQPMIIAQQPPISRRSSIVMPPLGQRQSTFIAAPPAVFPADTPVIVDSIPQPVTSISAGAPLITPPVLINEPGSSVPIRYIPQPAVVSPAMHMARPAPVVPRQDSPPPRRSRLRKARRPVPTRSIAARPVAIARSASPQHAAQPLSVPIPVGSPETPLVIPTTQAIVIPSGRPESLRSRRDLSDDSLVVLHAPPGPVMTTRPESQVPIIQSAVVHPSMEAHFVAMPQHSRPPSRTPSFVLPVPEESLPSESPVCRTYSTEERSPSPSYYRGRRRSYHERDSYSRSRTPSRYHRSETPSRPPSRIFCYTPTEFPPSVFPSPRSIYYSRGSPHLMTSPPADVEVVNYPPSRSLSRRRTYPSRDEYRYHDRPIPDSLRYGRGPSLSSSYLSGYSSTRSGDYEPPMTPIGTLRTSVPRRAVLPPRSPPSESTTESDDWIFLDEELESGSRAVSTRELPRTRSTRTGPMWKWIGNL